MCMQLQSHLPKWGVCVLSLSPAYTGCGYGCARTLSRNGSKVMRVPLRSYLLSLRVCAQTFGHNSLKRARVPVQSHRPKCWPSVIHAETRCLDSFGHTCLDAMRLHFKSNGFQAPGHCLDGLRTHLQSRSLNPECSSSVRDASSSCVYTFFHTWLKGMHVHLEKTEHVCTFGLVCLYEMQAHRKRDASAHSGTIA